MGITNNALWGLFLGLALMVIGSLVLWAYGARLDRERAASLFVTGPEAEATRQFHTKLVSWFLRYGVGAFAAGFVALVWASMSLI